MDKQDLINQVLHHPSAAEDKNHIIPPIPTTPPAHPIQSPVKGTPIGIFSTEDDPRVVHIKKLKDELSSLTQSLELEKERYVQAQASIRELTESNYLLQTETSEQKALIDKLSSQNESYQKLVATISTDDGNLDLQDAITDLIDIIKRTNNVT